MKTKIATALSLVGILGAGSAAALVNTQILDNGPTNSGASAAVLPPASSVTLTVPAAAPFGAAVQSSTTTSLPAASPVTTTSPAAAPAGDSLTAFAVGEAGVVTVDVIDGRLRLVSAAPKAGWTVTKAEDDSNDDSDEVEDEVEVEFSSSTVRVEFEAHLVDGQIVPEVTSRAIGGSSTGTPAPSNTIGGDDHDDDEYDDDHEDDEYDDDHEDDEDDDHDDDHEEDDRDDD